MQFEAMRSLSKYLSVTSKLKIKYTKKKMIILKLT